MNGRGDAEHPRHEMALVEDPLPRALSWGSPSGPDAHQGEDALDARSLTAGSEGT